MMTRQFTLLLLTATLALPQMRDNQSKDLKCEERSGGRDSRHRFCEVREQTTSAVPKFQIEPGKNGGVSVKGWLRNEVLVRSKVEAWAETEDQAKAMSTQVRVSASAGRIAADGPEQQDRTNWGVSFEIFVPQRTDVDVNTMNGGLHFTDIQGNIHFQTKNGGVHLSRVGGNVQGETTNGGIHVELAGDRWEGTQLDVKTRNGGVHVDMPEVYSARFETATVNGRVRIDMPGVTMAKDAREYKAAIGSGGPLVRVLTTNGGVHIGRKKATASR